MAVQCVLVGKGKDDVFTAVYNETTYEEVLKAYNENKVIQVIYQNRNTFYLDRFHSNTFYFSTTNATSSSVATLYMTLDDNSWLTPLGIKPLPLAHAVTHKKNGADPLSPADIGAMELSENVLKQSNEDITSKVAEALSGDLVPFSGGTMTGLLNVLTPVGDSNATTKKYVDDKDIIIKEYVDDAIKNNSGMKYETILPEVPSSPVSNLDDYTWEQINDIALSGRGKEYFALGATKSVTLSDSVLGTTTHNVMIIGINQDNDNSITFQTQNILSTSMVFSSNIQWIGSTARTYCQNYYKAFPGKDYILTVSKGTCAGTSGDRDASVTYNDETVWLPSEREMGLDSYSPISTANSTNTNAECTYGKNFNYEYYDNDDKRIKTENTSYQYWERSHYYAGGQVVYVCTINSKGNASYRNYNTTSTFLAPAFVIGNGIISTSKIVQNGENITSKILEVVGGMQTQIVSYVGTGTYGESNPNSLIFNFAPKIVKFLFKTNIDSGNYSKDEYFSDNSINSSEQYYMIAERLKLEFMQGEGFGYRPYAYGKKSGDGKTFTWYTSNVSTQGNSVGVRYYFIAFG
jgi:hypothetical protein